MADDNKETDTILCNWCNRPTTHILRARNHRPRRVGEGEVEEYGQPGDIITSIWTCAGCDAATFEERMIMVEDGDLGSCYFPPRYDETLEEVSARIEPKHFRQLNPVLTRIYNEVIKTFNEDCLVLCTMGLRALTEGICDDKNVRARDLNGMIDAFVRLVPNLNIIDALHAFRHLGNEAAHDLEGLSKENARVAIEFMEDFLSSLYELDNKAQKVRNLSPRAAFRSAKPDSVQ